MLYKILGMVWNGFCLLFVLAIIIGSLWMISSGEFDCRPGPGPACVTKK